MSRSRNLRLAVLASALVATGSVEAAVTYQGELRDGGQPANGAYDLQFCLFAEPTGGSSLACHDADDLAVAAGRFSAVLGFDASHFPGAARYVELRVRAGTGTGSHTTLAPRLALNPTPYAHTALTVPDASITAGKLAAGAVTATAIGANAVGGAHVADASITGADLAGATIGVAQVDTAQVQARVAGSCPDGEFMRAILADGGVMCAPAGDAPGGGGFAGILDAAGNQGLSNSIVLGTNGLPIVSYYDGDTGALKIARCDDAACDVVQRRTLYTPDFVLDPDNGPFAGTAIVLGAGGRPLIAFVDLKDESLKLIRCGDALCDGTLSVVPLAARGFVPSIALGGDGLPVIAASDDTFVLVLKCNDAACASFSTSQFLEPEFTQAGNISILNNGVGPFIAYARYGSGPPARVVTISCNDARCSSAALNTITPTTDDALLPDAARYSLGGFPVIAYYEKNAGALKLAFCANAACSSVSSFQPIAGGAGGIVGAYPSLAVDAAGFPVVSYLSFGIGLHVARCSSPNCAEAPTINLADVGGRDSSLVLRADGIPVISHYDTVEKDLRLTMCSNANCAGE